MYACLSIYTYIYIHNKDKEKKFTKRKSQSKFLNNFLNILHIPQQQQQQ